ncbi:MAG: alpha/beta hydrolase [Planctomycetota bacterium]
MKRSGLAVLALLHVLLASGCGTAVKPLMPTPVIFAQRNLDPVGHVPEAERFPNRRVYYATTRTRVSDHRKIDYGNRPSDVVSVGLSLIAFGNPSLTWDQLRTATSHADRDGVVELSVNGLVEAGALTAEMSPQEAARGGNAGWWLNDLRDSIDDARDGDLLIYVHGAKVDFYNGNAFAAQLDHFMGRDMTSLAFCWPTRQNILAYSFGDDVNRAYHAADSLATLIEVVAASTQARRIHIVCWSAGARVVTTAMTTLRERHPELDDETLKARFRLGTAYFAAGDIPRDEFLEALPTLCAMSDRVIVSVSSADSALISAKVFMGGATRIGQRGDMPSEQILEQLAELDGFEFIDVSLGKETRGFNMAGHEYWFSNPWASSDVLLAVRSDLPPEQRGLARDELPFVYYFPKDYPQRLNALPPRALLRKTAEEPSVAE